MVVWAPLLANHFLKTNYRRSALLSDNRMVCQMCSLLRF